MHIEPFEIDIAADALADLRDRLARTRWPDPAPARPWAQGTDTSFLRQFLHHWADGFDWSHQQSRLNEYDHFRAASDLGRIHFVHKRAANGDGLPIIITHGWPSTFVELLPLVPLLTDPASHGIDGPAFDVILPSLPGYAFSERADRAVTTRDTAQVWHQLMRQLGYRRYAAAGGDFGAAVTTFMALGDPNAMMGIHLTNLENAPYTGPGSPPLSAEEQAYIDAGEEWTRREGGYKAIQATRPQTIAYALNDSPAGMAAWILDKWRSWSDCGGDLEETFSPDFLLTMLTIFWVTGSISTSMRDYIDNRAAGTYSLGPDDHVEVPTAFAVFDNHHVEEPTPPRRWVERAYAVRRWTPMPRGGHFAPAEQPGLVARDIAGFFADG